MDGQVRGKAETRDGGTGSQGTAEYVAAFTAALQHAAPAQPRDHSVSAQRRRSARPRHGKQDKRAAWLSVSLTPAQARPGDQLIITRTADLTTSPSNLIPFLGVHNQQHCQHTRVHGGAQCPGSAT